jgi:hypothetical protein
MNWYLNSHTRIMFDYTAGIPDMIDSDPTVAQSSAFAQRSIGKRLQRPSGAPVAEPFLAIEPPRSAR